MKNTTIIDNRIAVLATMSSGKSTFINALLGEDLLPSENQACTGKIFEISNINKEYSIEVYVEDDKVINLKDKEELKEKNRDTSAKKIKINTEFYNIKPNITIFDTPGINSYINRQDREVTYNFLKNENIRNIIYMINAEHIGVEDDKDFLLDLKELYKNREINIIFLLNKFDKIDLEKESEKVIVENTKKYLEEIGFKNPLLIPTSVEKVRILRLGFKNILVTRSEKGKFEEYKNEDKGKAIDEYIESIRFNEIEKWITTISTSKCIKISCDNSTQNISISGYNMTELENIKRRINNYSYFKTKIIFLIIELEKLFKFSDIEIIFEGSNKNFNKLKEEIEKRNGKNWNIKYKHPDCFSEELAKCLAPYFDCDEKEIINLEKTSKKISILGSKKSGKIDIINFLLKEKFLPFNQIAEHSLYLKLNHQNNNIDLRVKVKTSKRTVVLLQNKEKIDINKFSDEGKIELLIDDSIQGIELKDIIINTICIPKLKKNLKDIGKKFINDVSNSSLFFYVLNIKDLERKKYKEILRLIVLIIKKVGIDAEKKVIFVFYGLDIKNTEKKAIYYDSYLKKIGFKNPESICIFNEKDLEKIKNYMNNI